MEKQKAKIKQFEISRYKNQYMFFGLSFGAKQEQTFGDSFEISYLTAKNSIQRNSIAWDAWLYKKQIKKGEN